MKKVVLLGEPMALLLADQEGPLPDVSHFTRTVSGAEVNVAIGLRRLGIPVEFLTRLGDDPFGHYIELMLKNNGIGTGMIAFDSEYRTGIQLKECVSDGRDPYAPYYRKGSAASHMTESDMEALDMSDVGMIHVTGIPPALSESMRKAVFALVKRAKIKQIPVSFDPNLRPALWENEARMCEVLNELSGYADFVFPGITECRILTGTDDKKKAAEFYHRKGVGTVVIKDGKLGAFLSTDCPDGGRSEKQIPGFPVSRVVDTVGAGDGFAAGFLSGFLEQLPLEACVLRANAIGALQVQHRGDNEGLPTREQLEAFISH